MIMYYSKDFSLLSIEQVNAVVNAIVFICILAIVLCIFGSFTDSISTIEFALVVESATSGAHNFVSNFGIHN